METLIDQLNRIWLLIGVESVDNSVRVHLRESRDIVLVFGEKYHLSPLLSDEADRQRLMSSIWIKTRL